MEIGGRMAQHAFTIGHSRLELIEFLRLIKQFDVTHVADVRTNPQSRWAPQFNRKRFASSLAAERLEYIHMGDALGGHPKDPELYEDGRVIYERITQRRDYRNAIKKLAALIERHTVAVMCTEKSPEDCHRHPLIAVSLLERGVEIDHILNSGELKSARSIESEFSSQLPLVEPVGEDRSNRSPKKILRAKNFKD